MINLRKNGFTLIELLAVIIILAVIALIATPIILGITNETKKNAFQDSVYGIVGAAKNAFVEMMYSNQSAQNVTYTYSEGAETSVPDGYVLNYEGAKPRNGQVALLKNGQVALVLHDGKYCATKSYSVAEVTVVEEDWATCQAKIDIVITMEFNDKKGVNNPKLLAGMTPIKWVNGVETVTTSDDEEWFDYGATSDTRHWANAKTTDGSYWVWIPRYAYQIATNYHTITAGKINIKFLKGRTNTAADGSTVDITPTYSGSSQTNYIKHPTFTFGSTEIAGMWVAKFEASGTTSAIEFKPNATSLRGITINDMFVSVRSMETNNRYGWGTSGNGIDTHMMKNTEWGAVAYLAQSTYGINSDIGLNNNSNFTTGCGAGAGTASSSTCNAYNTATGMLASTTGNVYGLYDMSGGTWEYVASYINNGNSNLNTYGSSIIDAASKYKDVYAVAVDDEGNNYYNNASRKGDALYEISIWGTSAWYSDNMAMPFNTNPWFVRGGRDTYDQRAGVFATGYNIGNISTNFTFRATLIVGSEGPTIMLVGNDTIEVIQGTAYTDAGATATDEKEGDLTSSIMTTGTVDINTIGQYTITYSVKDRDGNEAIAIRTINVIKPFYDVTRGVNRPILAAGMTPIKWNGTTWVNTTESDTAWYSYGTTSGTRNWANAKTADGSMWVWIPRYAYKITSNYHSLTNGTIAIKFLKDKTNISSDGTTVVESYDSANNYVKHPAFTFGGSEIIGIWVAKFEPSGTTVGSAIDFKPGVASIRSITVGTAFASVRQMETNSRYGWPLSSVYNGNTGVFAIDNNNLDVHMMRNTEWGAVAYIALSSYGANNNFNCNNSNTYITGGGAGTAYVTNIAQSASGNVYGIYDMRGGSWEYVMANYDNTAGSSGLTPSNINNRYIDRYSTTNSGYSNALYGDAIYETSNIEAATNSYGSWYTGYAIKVDATNPWFLRGDFYNNSNLSSVFTFKGGNGGTHASNSFRATIIVGAGL